MRTPLTQVSNNDLILNKFSSPVEEEYSPLMDLVILIKLLNGRLLEVKKSYE